MDSGLSRRMAYVLVVAVSLAAQTSVHAAGCVLEDNGITLRLENDYFRLTLRPNKGGTSLDFFYKPTNKQFIPQVESLPLFADTATEVGWRGPWVGNRYEYEVLAHTPDKVSVHLKGKDGSTFPFVYMHKTITMYRDRCYVEVEHAVEVDANNMVPVYISPWWHNGLAVVGEHTQYVTPVPSGLARCWDVENLNKWVNHPDVTRPWSAMIGESGTGLGIELTAYKHLETIWQSFYQREWCFEWRFNRVRINNGDRLTTKFWLIPFNGLSGVDGVGGRMVGYLNCPEKVRAAGPVKAALELCSGEARSAKVQVTAAPVVGRGRKVLLEEQVNFQTNKVRRFPFTFAPGVEGTFVLRCVVNTGDETICDFEKPIAAGKPSGRYAMRPAAERIPPEIMEREPMKLNAEVVTPHVKWAKPYYKGPVRALFAMEILGVRDIIELAQRMDLDYTAVKMSNSDSMLRYYGAPDEYGPPTNLECNDCLTTALKKEYDVIVIAALQWERLSGANRKAILAKAKKGTGLIYIDPRTVPDDLRAVLGIHEGAARASFGLPVRRKAHFLSNSLPYGGLFPCPCRGFKVDGGAGTFVPIETEHGAPMLVARDGPSRSVALVYGTGNAWGASLIPFWHGGYQHTWPEYDYGVRYAYWEYYYGLLARCLLWASHKEPDVTVSGFAVPRQPIQVEALKGKEIGVSVTKTSDGTASYQAELTLRDENYEKERILTQEVRLAKGDRTIAFRLPESLRNGLQLADFRLLNAQGKVVNWASTSFRVRARVRIVSCHLDRRIYCTDDPIKAQVVLEGVPLQRLRCEATVVDAHGRLLWRQGTTVPADRATFDNRTRLLYEFTLQPIANWHRFQFRLLGRGGLIQRTEQEFLVFPRQTKQPEWDDYVLSRTYPVRIASYRLADLYNAQLASLGYEKVDVWEHGFARKAHDVEAAFDFFQSGVKRIGVVCTTRIAGRQREYRKGIEEYKKKYKGTGDKMALARVPCLDDTGFWRDEKQRVEAAVRNLSQFHALCYYFGDENTLTRAGNHGDCCYSVHTLRTFRKWLQAEYYPTLDALNAEWGTTFETWDAVVPMTREEVRNRGNYAPWADHRSYMETAWARAYRTYKEIVRELSPYSFTGNAGSQRYQPDNGLDYWKFFREWDQAQARYAATWYGKFYRTFPDAPIVTPYGAIGWNRQGDVARYGVWKNAFELRGAGDSAYPSIKKVAPDLSISRSGRSVEQITRPLRRGVGKLLRSLDIVGDGVAIHYSQSSIHGEFIIGHAECITKSQSAWVHLLRDLGIDPGYVSYAQVENGELVKAGYKLFIMPFSVAVSKKEVEQIKAFVRRGGIVIADAMTGVMDGHCKPWNPSPVDELFGLRREREPEGRSGKVLIAPRGPFSALDRGVLLMTSFTEGGLAPVRAKAKGRLSDGQPALFVNDYAKGKAVRLGFLISDYPLITRYDAKRREQMQGVFRALLGLAGVARHVHVADEHGRPLPFCEVWRFRRGAADYVGLIREHASKANLKEERIKVAFPEKRHVYDILGRRYLGRTNKIETVLAPASPAFYALFRERVAGVKVTSQPDELDRRGKNPVLTLRYEIAVLPEAGDPQDHALRVEVTGPDGNARSFYAANVFAKRGKAQGDIRLALNDPRGTWKITARDIVSNLSGTATFSVK